MTKVLKVVLLWLVVGAVVWLLTLWHWQRQSVDVNLFDIVGNLLLLPTLIVAVWLLVLWSLRRIKAHANEPAATPHMPKGLSSPRSVADADLRQAHAWVLDAAMHTRAGADAPAAWQSLLDGQTRVDLDPHLQDLDGMPVFSARVPDLDLVDAAESQEANGAPPMAVARCQALLTGPFAQLLETWSALTDELAQAQGFATGQSSSSNGLAAAEVDWSAKAHLSGVASPVGHAGTAEQKTLSWQVQVLMPAAWSEAERSAVLVALQAQWQDTQGASSASCVAEPHWQVRPLVSPESWWTDLDATVTRWTRDGTVEALLILAVDSALDERAIEHWQAIGELFTSHHQTGRIPGEAAVGLLMVSPALLERIPEVALPQAPVRVSRPVSFKRDKSADAAGRVGSSTLAEAMSHVMTAGQIDPSDRLMVVSDADHRASRTAELFEALQAVAPGLDPMLNVARSGEALGDVGVARTLLSTALGCAAVWHSQGEHVALVTHVQSSHDRVVLSLSASST